MSLNESIVNGLLDINDLYRYLDENALILARKRDIKNLLVAFRNKTTDDKEKEIAQWELEAFLFDLKGKGVFSYAYSPGSSAGDYQKYPSTTDFKDQSAAYLLSRAQSIIHPFLQARYYHLLWRSPVGVKNKDYATLSAQAYFICIDLYLAKFETDQEEDNLSKVCDIFETLVLLVAEIKEKVAEIKQLANRLLYNCEIIPFWIKHSILNCMLEAKSIFKPDDFTGCLPLLEQAYSQMDEDSGLWIFSYIKTCLIIARKTKSDVKIWFERLGDLLSAKADSETNPERNWLKNDLYTSSLEAYKNSGNIGKRKAIEQAIFELKPLITLPSIGIRKTKKEIKDLEFRNKFIKSSCEALLKEDPDIVYDGLIQGWYYPPLAHFRNVAQEKKYAYEDLFTLVEYDRNKNVRKRSETHTSRKFNDLYHHAVEEVTLQYFYYVFVPGIQSGHLTYENFLGHLRKHTWLGKPYLKRDMGGNEITVDWIMLITPAIVEYFIQVQSWQWGNSYFPNFILCIDSLTLKMEGMLRNFSEQMTISTTVAGKSGTQEAYVHNVLENPAVIKHFDEDDLQFFKYLFTNEGGTNLRNNVAHCFYHFYDYNLDKMHLLLAALIKIAKFQVA